MKEHMPEDIILDKEYFELSTEEKELVGQWAANEQQYEALRESLRLIHEDAQVMEPAPAHIKESLMASFQQEAPNRFVWLNTIWGWMMPPERPFYARPAFQLAGVGVLAAVLLLVVRPFSTEKAEGSVVAQQEVVSEEGMMEQKLLEDQKVSTGEEFSELALEQSVVEDLDRSIEVTSMDAEGDKFSDEDRSTSMPYQWTQGQSNQMNGSADYTDELNSAGYSYSPLEESPAAPAKEPKPDSRYRAQTERDEYLGYMGRTDALSKDAEAYKKNDQVKSNRSMTVAEELDLYSLIEVAY